jgi:hypothetical protein
LWVKKIVLPYVWLVLIALVKSSTQYI